MKLKYLSRCRPRGVRRARRRTQVDVRTNVGTIRSSLYPEKAPKSWRIFCSTCATAIQRHRVPPRVDGFMIQGGGFDGGSSRRRRPPVANEAQPREGGLKKQPAAWPWRAPRIPIGTGSSSSTSATNSFLNWGDPRSDGNGYAVSARSFPEWIVTKIRRRRPSGAPSRRCAHSPVVIESMTMVTEVVRALFASDLHLARMSRATSA